MKFLCRAAAPIASLALLLLGPSALAQAGSLDPNFGTGGMVIGPLGTAYAVAVQQDGRILAAGSITGAEGLTVVRYLANGQIDASFGSSGIASVGFGSDQVDTYGVAVQADGKIVLAGQDQAGPGEVAVGRLNTDG